MINTTTTVEGKTLTIKRTLHAPRELVWEVWTKPAHIVQWWGPVGFTTTSLQMDMKTGGSWRFIMHGPDGRAYPNRIIFMEVSKPEKLIYRHSGDEDTEPIDFQVTVLFKGDGNCTELTIQYIFSSAEDLERVNKIYGVIQGSIDTVNRLDDYLVHIKTGYQAGFTVNVPADTVFALLTTKINAWWTTDVEGAASRTNDIFTIRFDNTFKTFRVEEINPEKIIWKCIDAHIDVAAIENKTEWQGTKIIWEIALAGTSTQVNMIHYGLTPSFECYEICEQGWIQFIGSLNSLITTGKGMPYQKQQTITTVN